MDVQTIDTLPMLVRMLVALIAVIGLMGGLALILKKAGLSGALAENDGSGKTKRLKVIERLPLDARRQLAIISCDSREHLIILSATGETVIDTGLKAPTTKKDKAA